VKNARIDMNQVVTKQMPCRAKSRYSRMQQCGFMERILDIAGTRWDFE